PVTGPAHGQRERGRPRLPSHGDRCPRLPPVAAAADAQGVGDAAHDALGCGLVAGAGARAGGGAAPGVVAVGATRFSAHAVTASLPSTLTGAPSRIAMTQTREHSPSGTRVGSPTTVLYGAPQNRHV